MWNWYNSFHINLHYKIQMNIISNVSQGFFLFRQVAAEKGTDIVNVYLRSQEEQENLAYMNCISKLFCVWHSFIVQRAIHVSLSLASPFWAHNSNLCVTIVNIQYWAFVSMCYKQPNLTWLNRNDDPCLLSSTKVTKIIPFLLANLLFSKNKCFLKNPKSYGQAVIISFTETKLMLPFLPPAPSVFTWSFQVKSGATFSRTRSTVRVIGWIVASMMMEGIWWTHCFTFNPIFTWCSIWPAKKTSGVTNLHFQEKAHNSDFQIGF